MATLENPDVTTARKIIEMVRTHGYYVVMAEFEDYSAEAHRYLTHKYRGQYDWRKCRYAINDTCLYIWDSPVAVMKKEKKKANK